MEMEDWKNLSEEELARYVSPSRWRKGKSSKEVIDEFIEVTLNGKIIRNKNSFLVIIFNIFEYFFTFNFIETKKAVGAVPSQLNLAYGATASQKLDIYGTDLPNNAPILVFIHGGYWQGMDSYNLN